MTTPAVPSTTMVVIVNPTKFDDLDEVREEISGVADARGVGVRIVETTEDDPGFGQTRQAVAEGADVVCALGGDGTVRAVAQVLAGTGVPLGLLPGGTGNLLARNLGVPLSSIGEALTTVIDGVNRSVDIGWLEVDPGEGASGIPDPAAANVHAFTVMAGLGFDATIMDDAPEGVKDTVGWAAYVIAAAKHLRGEGFQAEVTLDGATSPAAGARTVIVGNCGTLTGGIVLLPDAVIDDALLDLAVLTPESLTQWAALAGRVVTGQAADGPSIARSQGREVVIVADPPQPVEVDGDVLEVAGRIRATLTPGALVVRVATDTPAESADGR
ncbi:MAG: NAD(+)/NADH kinase [Tetrasphaera sp.]|jgi:diacylglycerol kinase (ATP)|nr:NAD(+)/NADH kinase [Tetrasphaera sp.]